MKIEKDCRYMETHEWVRVVGDLATAGITDYAQGAALHKTGIPIRGQDASDIPLLVEDVEQFLHLQIGAVKVSPIWFPG